MTQEQYPTGTFLTSVILHAVAPGSAAMEAPCPPPRPMQQRCRGAQQHRLAAAPTASTEKTCCDPPGGGWLDPQSIWLDPVHIAKLLKDGGLALVSSLTSST